MHLVLAKFLHFFAKFLPFLFHGNFAFLVEIEVKFYVKHQTFLHFLQETERKTNFLVNFAKQFFFFAGNPTPIY